MKRRSGSGYRPKRLAEQIRQVVTAFLQAEARDPRIGLVTVIAVDVTGDLQHTHVRYVVHGDEAQRQATQEGLDAAAAAIRRRIGAELRVRVVPEVTFVADKGFEHASRIEQLLAELKRDGDKAP